MLKRRSTLSPVPTEGVNFLDADVSGESPNLNNSFEDPLQQIHSNWATNKSPIKKPRRILNVNVKPEPLNEVLGDEIHESSKSTLIAGIKREISESSDHSTTASCNEIVQSSPLNNVTERVTRESVVPNKSSSLLTLIKYEIMLDDDNENEYYELTSSKRLSNKETNDYSLKNDKLESKVNSEISNSKITQTFVEDNKMFHKKPKQSEDFKNRLKEFSTIDDDSSNSGSDEKSSPKKDEAEKQKLDWNSELIILAVNAVREKKMGILRAATVFQIPKNVLLKYISEEIGREKNIKLCSVVEKKKTFSPQEEKDLVGYLSYAQERYFGLTKEEARSMVGQFTKLFGIEQIFGTNGQPGYAWLKEFLARNSSITPKSPRELRKKSSVSKFFALIKREVEAINCTTNMIFNVDETAFSIVHTRNPQFRLMKRQEQVFRAKKDSYLTVIICKSAAGSFVPPMFIFPRHKISADMMKGAPPGSVAACHPSGWVQLEIFTEWFRHFINNVKPSKENPALLIVDGQQSHTKNVEVIQLAQKNHVSIISLPHLTINKLKPVYKSFMNPLKIFYSDEVQLWMNQNLRPLSLDVIVELFGKAYLQLLEGNIDAQGIMPPNPKMISGNFPDLRIEDDEGAKVEQFITLMMAHLSTPDELKSVKLTLKPSTSETLNESETIKDSCLPSALIPSEEEKGEEECDEYRNKKIKSEIENKCMFCKQLQSEDIESEKWIQCISCDLWSHYECASYDNGEYVCDYCRIN